MTGQSNFDTALRFDLNAPCETAHISLTLSACFTQPTGVFVVVLVALALAGSLGIVLASIIMLSAMLYLPSDDVCYTMLVTMLKHCTAVLRKPQALTTVPHCAQKPSSPLYTIQW